MMNYLDNGAKSGVYAGFYAGIALSIFESIFMLLVTLATKNATFGLGYLPLLILIPLIPAILIVSILIWTALGAVVGWVVRQWRLQDNLPKYSTYAVIVVCIIAILVHVYLIVTGGLRYIIGPTPLPESLWGVYFGIGIKVGQRRFSQLLALEQNKYIS